MRPCFRVCDKPRGLEAARCALEGVWWNHRSTRFANGNVVVEVDPLPPKMDEVVILLSVGESSGAEVLELALLVDAIRRHTLARIRCVICYLHYSRSNRLNQHASALGAHVYVKLLCSLGIQQFTIFDLHAVEVAGFFHVPVHYKSTVPLFAASLRNRIKGIDYVIAPDKGRYDDGVVLARELGVPLECFLKVRHGHSEAQMAEQSSKPHLRGARVVLFDDEISTGNTMNAVLARLGADGVAEVHMAVVYTFACAPVLHRLRDGQLTSFTTTNLIFDGSQSDAVEILDAFQLLAG